MEPALPGGSVVTVSPARGDVQPGQVVLARNPEGRLVLHRVRVNRGGRIVLQGDAARRADPPLPPNSVLGVVPGAPAPSWAERLRHALAPVRAELTVTTAGTDTGTFAARYLDPRDVLALRRHVGDGLDPAEETFTRRFLRTGGSLLDIGCGLGRATLALARRGVRVTGIDPVRSLIEEVRERAAGLPATFETMSAQDLARTEGIPGPFDAMLLSAGLYSFLPLRRERLRLLRALRARLAPGGAIALSAWEGPAHRGPRTVLVRATRSALQTILPGRFRWEEGDRMLRYVTESGTPGPWVFCHRFAPGRIERELALASFPLVERIGPLAVARA